MKHRSMALVCLTLLGCSRGEASPPISPDRARVDKLVAASDAGAAGAAALIPSSAKEPAIRDDCTDARVVETSSERVVSTPFAPVRGRLVTQRCSNGIVNFRRGATWYGVTDGALREIGTVTLPPKAAVAYGCTPEFVLAETQQQGGRMAAITLHRRAGSRWAPVVLPDSGAPARAFAMAPGAVLVESTGLGGHELTVVTARGAGLVYKVSDYPREVLPGPDRVVSLAASSGALLTSFADGREELVEDLRAARSCTSFGPSHVNAVTWAPSGRMAMLATVDRDDFLVVFHEGKWERLALPTTLDDAFAIRLADDGTVFVSGPRKGGDGTEVLYERRPGDGYRLVAERVAEFEVDGEGTLLFTVVEGQGRGERTTLWRRTREARGASSPPPPPAAKASL